MLQYSSARSTLEPSRIEHLKPETSVFGVPDPQERGRGSGLRRRRGNTGSASSSHEQRRCERFQHSHFPER